MAWVRQDAVGVPEYVEYLRSVAERQRVMENEWRDTRRVPPPEILRRMDAATQQAKQSILAARTLAPKSPYMREMVASAFVLEYLTRRDIAFSKAAIAFSLSGGDLGYEKTRIKETGVNRKGEVLALMQEIHDCDRMIRALAKRFCPRRPEMRPARDYYWERIVCKMMGGELVLRDPSADEAEAVARQISE